MTAGTGPAVSAASATEVAPPARFAVRVPENWYEFDVLRATRTADLARMVDERVARLPALAAHRGAVLRMLREVAADAERRGAVCCAAMAEPDGAGGTLLATVMGFVTTGAADPADNTVEAIAAQWRGTQPDGTDSDVTDPGAADPGAAEPGAAEPGGAEPGGAGTGAAGTGGGRRVSVVELPAGRGVRSQGIERLQLGDQGMECVVMQTVLPVPGDPALVNVVLVSPNVELAEPLLDLFDAVSATLTWLEPEPSAS